MKRIVSVVLMSLLVIGSVGMSFAATLSDVENTSYKSAVENLVNKNIISGYPDNTFKPENKITRDEACTVVVNAMNPSKEVLAATSSNKFSDVSGSWAATNINFAADKGIVNGYNDGTFGPKNNVTYFEMAAMLVNACGISQSDLTGTWPDNYFNKATELGILKDIVTPIAGFDGNADATRGNVAIMTNVVADRIADVSKRNGYSSITEQSDPTGGVSDKKETSAALKDQDGLIYGIIVGSTEMKTSGNSTVQYLEILYNGATEYAVTDKKDTFDGNFRTNGTLDCIKMSDGVVMDITDPGKATNNYLEYTVPNGYTPVINIKERLITISKSGAETDLTIAKDASIYLETTENGKITYKPGTLGDIQKGKQVRLYGITGSSSPTGPVEIVVLK